MNPVVNNLLQACASSKATILNQRDVLSGLKNASEDVTVKLFCWYAEGELLKAFQAYEDLHSRLQSISGLLDLKQPGNDGTQQKD